MSTHAYEMQEPMRTLVAVAIERGGGGDCNADAGGPIYDRRDDAANDCNDDASRDDDVDDNDTDDALTRCRQGRWDVARSSDDDDDEGVYDDEHDAYDGYDYECDGWRLSFWGSTDNHDFHTDNNAGHGDRASDHTDDVGHGNDHVDAGRARGRRRRNRAASKRKHKFGCFEGAIEVADHACHPRNSAPRAQRPTRGNEASKANAPGKEGSAGLFSPPTTLNFLPHLALSRAPPIAELL